MTLAIMILLMGGTLLTKHLVSYFQGNAVLAVSFTVKAI